MSKQIKTKISDMPNKLPMDRLELKSKRTEYSTRYLNPDGSFTEEIFLESKFYKDSGKEWKEIDNSLVASAKRTGKLGNKAGSVKILFSQQADMGEIASLEKGGMHIGLIPLDAGSTDCSAKNDAVTYKNIYKDADIRYRVKGNNLKEDIVLNSNTGKNIFSFELKLKGLKAVQEGEIIYFRDKDSQIAWYIKKPYMTDAEGNISSLVTLSLRKENRKTYVDITADQAFLSGANTKYPVTIDPTISTWDIMSDMFISGLNPNSSYPNYTSVYTGNTPSYGATRSLIRFFLPPLPSDSKIISSNFNAYQTKADATNTSIDLYRITTGWTETATWNTQPATNATAESTVTSNTSNAYWQWYITQLTKDWYSGAAPNYGFMLRQQNEAATPYRAFNSVEAVTNTPRLTINFTVDPIGLEDFWSYTKDNVNPANGNLVLQQTDLSVPGRGIPVEITRTYNSRKSDVAGIFGYGWRSNAEAQIIDSGSGPITYVDGDNTHHIFGQSSSGYVAAEGVYLELDKDVDLNGVITYTITHTDDTKLYFNAGGKITSIADPNDNVTQFTYTAGKLTTITDASGRTTTIAYGTNSFVSGITHTADRTFGYEYDAAGNLTKVTDPAGKFFTMGYDTSHNLTTVTDQRNTTTTIGYDTANDRVSTISRPITIDGAVQTSTTSYAYDTANLVTTVTDGENRKIQYTCNTNSNVIQITENPLDSANKAITTYSYDDDNNLTQVKTPNENRASGSSAYVYTYDENGNITQVKLPENQSASYTYDNGSDLIKGKDFNGNDSSYAYDPDHNQLESTDPNMQTSASRYYDNGNLNGNLWYTTNLMSTADNLLANSSFEMDANNTNWPDSWSQLVESGKTAAFAWSQTAKFGNRSVSISNPTGWAVVSSDYISANDDDKFIVSGYIKTTNATGYALIKIDFYQAPDQWIDQTVSYGLKGTHDWTRVQAVIDSIPEGTTLIRVSAGMDPGAGTAYFDGMQLERGTVLSAYNLIDNSSFERIENNQPVNWTRNNLTTSDTLDYSEHYVGLVSFKITGQAGVNKSVSQRINISGDQNTKLTLSGWSKQTGASAAGGYLTQLAIHYTTNGGWIGWQGNDFSLAEGGWQHIAAEINPEDVFDWIEVYYQYSNQTGTAWFDAARLEIGPSHTSYTYDTAGNYVASVTDPMGNLTRFTYDPFGNILNLKDPKNQITYYAYDNRNLLTQVTDAKNGITSYGYDNAGNRTTATDARNKITTYEYNEFNQVSKITNPLNQITQFGYNKNDQNVKTVFPKGDSITNSYNALNRLDSVFYNGVQKWGYTYDANGNVTANNNIAAGITTTNIYDKNDRIVNVQEGPDNQFDYGYDGNSNLISLTLTAGTTSHQYGYAYDSLDQMTALSWEGSDLAKFIYDERGNVISERNANKTYTAREYDGSNRLAAIRNYNAAGAILNIYTYSYDADGNRTGVVTGGGTINYQYDQLNRLTQETLLDGTTISYEYDAAGNRTKKTAGTIVTNYTYNDGNQLTSLNGQAYTYDANGSLTNNGAKTFVYNEVNQLTQVKNSGGSIIASFTYDDQGRRISSTVSGSTYQYHYSGDKVIYIADGNNNILNEFSYDSQGNPATMRYNGATYYYQIDGHGNVIALTDASGNSAAQYTYDAWGNILTQSGTVASANPLRYSGYMYDGSTGLYYLMARYYDPGVGRFITIDTFHGFEDDPQSLNQYTYCNNNPVMYVDPSGRYEWYDFYRARWFVSGAINTVISLIIGGSVSALSGYLKQRVKAIGIESAKVIFSQSLKKALLNKGIKYNIAQKVAVTVGVLFTVLMWALDPGTKIFDYIDARDKVKNNKYLDF